MPKSQELFYFFLLFLLFSKLLDFSSLRKICPAGFLQILGSQRLRTRPSVTRPERRCPARGLGSLPHQACYMCPILQDSWLDLCSAQNAWRVCINSHHYLTKGRHSKSPNLPIRCIRSWS